MKSSLVLTFLCIAFSLKAQFSAPEIAMQEMKNNGLISRSLGTGAESNTNIIYDRIELYVDPAVLYINGKVTTRFITDKPITYLEFDLSDSLLIDSVIYHGQALQYSQGNDILHANLPSGINGSVTDSVAIYYEGVPYSGDGFGAFIQTTHDSVPIIWTLSEPYGAKDWWPCKQDLKDKIDSFDMLITTPSAYKAASNGLLVEETSASGNTTYHWKHRYPIATYLICMAVSNYRVFNEFVPYHGDTLKILNYMYPEDYDVDSIQSTGVIEDMQLYDSLFELYPFSKEKYGQVQFGWGGGMEHQTMTFICCYGFEIMAHELAHHWFGDKVTCGSWQDIWLNEGFAVYLSTLCYKAFQPEYYLASKSGNVNNAIQSPHGSVYCDDTTSVARIFDDHLTYSKGSVVLHQLGWMFGEDVFFQALRDYLADTSNAYAFGSTGKLKAHLEEVTGIDLTDYFNQYYYGKGFPSYHVQWSQDFSRNVKFTLNQTQSDSSVSFFRMPVPIQFKSAGNDTILIFDPITASAQNYSFQLPYLVDTVIVDPNFEILSGNNSSFRYSTYSFSCMVYPNPASGTLQLQLQSEQYGTAELKIYNVQGQLVWNGTYALLSGGNLYTVDIRSLPAGVYQLKASSGKQSTATKFVVANTGLH